MGDTLSIINRAGETFNIEIIGLFSPKQLERFNEQVTTYDKIKNQVFLDLKSMIAIENSDAITGFLDVSGLVTTFLLIILIVGAVVLSHILTLWARGRVHETGILLSIGISKISIRGGNDTTAGGTPVKWIYISAYWIWCCFLPPELRLLYFPPESRPFLSFA